MSTSQDHGSQLNFEDLHAEAAKLDPKTVEHAVSSSKSATGAIGIPQVCSIYKTVRPFLAIILRIPLIPGGIKTAIKAFMGVMDTLCP